MKKRILPVLFFSAALSLHASDPKRLLGGWSSKGKDGNADLCFFPDGTLFIDDCIGEYKVSGDSLKFSVLYNPSWEILDIKYNLTEEILVISYRNFQGRVTARSYVRVGK